MGIPKISDLDASRHLINIAWSEAFLRFAHSPWLHAIAASAIRTCAHDLNPQGIANFAWAFATLARLHRPLFTSLSASARRKRTQFDEQCMANPAWSEAALQCLDQPLLDAIASSSLPLISSLCAQSRYATSWSVWCCCDLVSCARAWGISNLSSFGDTATTASKQK